MVQGAQLGETFDWCGVNAGWRAASVIGYLIADPP